MATMTIDNSIYKRAELYARQHNVSVEKLVEQTIVQLISFQPAPSRNEVALTETDAYKQALAYVKTLSVKAKTPVPADAEGMEALIDEKYAQ